MFQLWEGIEWVSRWDWKFKQNLLKSLPLKLNIEEQPQWNRYDS